jgi:hypothetical protein
MNLYNLLKYETLNHIFQTSIKELKTNIYELNNVLILERPFLYFHFLQPCTIQSLSSLSLKSERTRSNFAKPPRAVDISSS